MENKLTYKLSIAADKDLNDIFDYTQIQFGKSQAITYLNEIESIIFLLLNNPYLGKERNEIRLELRSIKCNSHIIFYRIFQQHLRIVRVLHTSKDLEQFSD